MSGLWHNEFLFLYLYSLLLYFCIHLWAQGKDFYSWTNVHGALSVRFKKRCWISLCQRIQSFRFTGDYMMWISPHHLYHDAIFICARQCKTSCLQELLKRSGAVRLMSVLIRVATQRCTEGIHHRTHIHNCPPDLQRCTVVQLHIIAHKRWPIELLTPRIAQLFTIAHNCTFATQKCIITIATQLCVTAHIFIKQATALHKIRTRAAYHSYSVNFCPLCRGKIRWMMQLSISTIFCELNHIEAQYSYLPQSKASPLQDQWEFWITFTANSHFCIAFLDEQLIPPA